jgi:hypothetical protein
VAVGGRTCGTLVRERVDSEWHGTVINNYTAVAYFTVGFVLIRVRLSVFLGMVVSLGDTIRVSCLPDTFITQLTLIKPECM